MAGPQPSKPANLVLANEHVASQQGPYFPACRSSGELGSACMQEGARTGGAGEVPSGPRNRDCAMKSDAGAYEKQYKRFRPINGAGSSSATVLARQGCASVPALPPAIWRHVLGFLSTPHLMRAAPTSRLFAEVLAERVREAVNRCLAAAEQRWGAELLTKFAAAASLARFGLDPFTLQALPHIPPNPDNDTLKLRVARIWQQPGRELKCESVIKDVHMPDFRVHSGLLVLVSASGHCGVSVMRPGSQLHLPGSCANEMDAANGSSLGIEVWAPREVMRDALGWLLAAARVERQQVVREGPGSLSVRVRPAVWVESGNLCLKVSPTRLAAPKQDGNVSVCPMVKFESLDDRLGGGLADALCLAAALQRCLELPVEKDGEMHGEEGNALLRAHLTRHCQCFLSGEDAL